MATTSSFRRKTVAGFLVFVAFLLVMAGAQLRKVEPHAPWADLDGDIRPSTVCFVAAAMFVVAAVIRLIP